MHFSLVFFSTFNAANEHGQDHEINNSQVPTSLVGNISCNHIEALGNLSNLIFLNSQIVYSIQTLFFSYIYRQ